VQTHFSITRLTHGAHGKSYQSGTVLLWEPCFFSRILLDHMHMTTPHLVPIFTATRPVPLRNELIFIGHKMSVPICTARDANIRGGTNVVQ
jgi:hypothetical protein